MNRWRTNFWLACALPLCAALASLAVPAAAQVLYDGTLGTTPTGQGQIALGSFPSVQDSYNSTGKYTTLDTSSSNGTYAGYSNYTLGGSKVSADFPTLDAAAGFTLNFTVQVNSENNVPTATGTPPSLTGSPRAGLSVILLDSQHVGIEIGFDTNSIFSQSSDFTTSSEFASSALPTSLTSYSLTIQGTGATPTYTLSSGGLTLLTGASKQYAGPAVVYDQSSFLFIGDDTTANGGSFNLQSANISAGGAANAPEPGSLAFVALGAASLFCAGRRMRRRPGRA